MAETKDNTLSIIALVALVAVVGMVVAFAVSSKGEAQATPVYVSAPASSEQAKNAAGQMMEMEGDYGTTETCGNPPAHCNGYRCHVADDGHGWCG